MVLFNSYDVIFLRKFKGACTMGNRTMGRGLEAAVRAPSTYVIVFLIGLILASFSEMPASVDVPVHVTLSSWDISKSGRGRVRACISFAHTIESVTDSMFWQLICST